MQTHRFGLAAAACAILAASGLAAQVGNPSVYCQTTANSTGQHAAIDMFGTFSVTTNQCSLVASGCPANSAGMFFYGPEPFEYPFGNGYLCVSPFSPGIIRLRPVEMTDNNGACMRWVDMTNLPLVGQIEPGSTWYFQFWYRDRFGGGEAFNLTHGLQATFNP